MAASDDFNPYLPPDEMEGLYEEEQETGDGERNGPPWETGRNSVGRRFWATAKGILFHSVTFFRTMRLDGGIGGPLSFAVLGSLVGCFGYYVWIAPFVLYSGFNEMRGQTGFLWIMVLGMGVLFAALPVIVIVQLMVQTLILHVCLMMVGGAKQRMEATFRAAAYTTGGVSLLMVFPFCGFYLLPFWQIGVLIIALMNVHSIGLGRTLLACVIPLLLALAVIAIAASGPHQPAN